MTALVGVLGGVGPAATARFSTLLVERANARRDQDHVRTLVLNDAALPDRTAFLLGRSGVSPAPGLARNARMLEAAGCGFLALPCNTAHAFAGAVRRAVGIPLVSIVDEAVRTCCDRGLSRVGVLATEGTVAADLYGRALKAQGLSCAYPSPALQARVTALVYEGVKAGRAVPADAVARLCAALAAQGCDGVVLGCTELSCAAPEAGELGPATVVDSLAALADAVILRAGVPLRGAAEGARSALGHPLRTGAQTTSADVAASSARPSREEAPCAAS